MVLKLIYCSIQMKFLMRRHYLTGRSNFSNHKLTFLELKCPTPRGVESVLTETHQGKWVLVG